MKSTIADDIERKTVDLITIGQLSALSFYRIVRTEYSMEDQ